MLPSAVRPAAYGCGIVYWKSCSTLWQPAAFPSFGILYVIIDLIAGTFLAILIGVPIGVMTAIFLAEVALGQKVADVVPAELLAGIPSVIYGLLGTILNPLRINWN